MNPKILFLLLILILLTGCSCFSLDISDLSNDPRRFVGKEIEVYGEVDMTDRNEWAIVKNCDMDNLDECDSVYVKKATPDQAFEFNVEYVVKGIARYGETPYGEIGYIEADGLIKKKK